MMDRVPARLFLAAALAGGLSCGAALGADDPGAGDRALAEIDRGKTASEGSAVPARIWSLLSEKATSSQRKIGFIRAVLPLVLHANDAIARDRLRIEILQIYRTAGVASDPEDAAWLSEIAGRYGLAPGTERAEIDLAALLARVDIVPPSLALAQAAEESGWGRSRFARKGNALFGQRIYGGTGGIVPFERPDGETFRVRRFDRVIDAVRAYLHNLNTHYAYDSFRRTRANMRRERGTLDGYGLASTLTNYSERRESYLLSIRTIMRQNGFQALDRLQSLGERATRPDT